MERQSLRVAEVIHRGEPIRIEVDGETVEAFDGETLAGALIASGRRILRYTPRGSGRSAFCGMGSCFDCIVEVDGEPMVRSCITPVRAGMKVRIPRPGEGGV